MGKVGYSTLGEVIHELLCTLPRNYIEKVKKMSASEFRLSEHFSLGLMIRNKYFHQNPAKEKLIKNMGDLIDDPMLLDGDEFSRIILGALYREIITGQWIHDKKNGESDPPSKHFNETRR